MNVNLSNDAGIHVTLSKRNIDTLLKMLTHDVADRTLYRMTPSGRLAVTIESDEEHYGDDPRPVTNFVSNILRKGDKHD